MITDSINAANDPNIKERFILSMKKAIQAGALSCAKYINENEFKEIYNDFLEFYINKHDYYAKKHIDEKKVIPAVFEALSRTLASQNFENLEYLNESKEYLTKGENYPTTKEVIKNFDRNGSKKALETKNFNNKKENENGMLHTSGSKDVPNAVKKTDKDIETLEKESKKFEKAISELVQKRHNLEIDKPGDPKIKEFTKEITSLQGKRDMIEKRIGKIEKLK